MYGLEDGVEGVALGIEFGCEGLHGDEVAPATGGAGDDEGDACVGVVVFVGVVVGECESWLSCKFGWFGGLVGEVVFFGECLLVLFEEGAVGVVGLLFGGVDIDADECVALFVGVVEVDLAVAGVECLPGGGVFKREFEFGAFKGECVGVCAGGGGGRWLVAGVSGGGAGCFDGDVLVLVVELSGDVANEEACDVCAGVSRCLVCVQGGVAEGDGLAFCEGGDEFVILDGVAA